MDSLTHNDNEFDQFLGGLFSGDKRRAKLAQKQAEAEYTRSISEYLRSLASGKGAGEKKGVSTGLIIVAVLALGTVGYIGYRAFKN